MSIARILALWVLMCAAAPVCAQARYAFDTTPGNLPKHVVPSRYALAFDLDPAHDDFAGSASIAVTVREPVAQIVLHAHELIPKDVSLSGPGGSYSLKVTPDPKTQTWKLARADSATIAAGQYTLQIRYSGVVHRSSQGLYRAEYSVEGKPARMLATQLQAVFARTLFPCFDEPSFRAVFEISVRAPEGFEVASNMPLAARELDAVVATHRFQPTPPMPSYLVAVAVGKFDALAAEVAGVPLRILTAAGKREQGRYAMEATRRILPYYAEYFGLPYALPKLDQLALASTRLGAMEDWGLISYAEDALLYDAAKSSPDTQRRVFSVLAHEVAHQWFGDLVTAASWEEIWLNEAFATWLARKATARFNPDWQVELRQRLPVDWVMERDAGTATRAIRSGPVRESSVFADVFDDITYLKGGAVLSMLEQWMGPEVFRRGLAAYMQDRKYSNATAGDLWHHLSRASGRDVSEVASSWTDQPGFPLVRVRSECREGRTRVALSQSRFMTLPGSASPQTWRIPVRLARGESFSTVLLEAPEMTLELDGCTGDPLVANAGGAGFYRVAYDAEHLDALTNRFVLLAPVDRVTLLSDAFALAQAGQVPLGAYFRLLAAIPGVEGPDRATLFAIAQHGLVFLDEALAGTPAQLRVRAAGRSLFGQELARLGWTPRPGEDAEAVKLRGALISVLARFDDAPVVSEAVRRFDLDASGKEPLPAAIRAAVIHVVGMHADRARFDQLLARLKTAGGEEERHLYATALAGGRDEPRAREFLSASLGGWLAPNIAASIPGMVGGESPFGKLAYDFALANWERLARLGGEMFNAKAWLLPDAASSFNEAGRAERLIADQRLKTGEEGAAVAERTAYRIRLLAAFREREADRLDALLRDWRPAP